MDKANEDKYDTASHNNNIIKGGEQLSAHQAHQAHQAQRAQRAYQAHRAYRAHQAQRAHRARYAAIAVAAVLCAALAVFTLYSYAAEPGSTADPIALKSYVDSKISALESKLTAMIQGSPQNASSTTGAAPTGGGSTDDASLSARIDELSKSVESLKQDNETLRRSIRQTAASAGGDNGDGGIVGFQNYSDQFIVLELLADQRVLLGAGSEFVLRTGKALAIRGELGALVDLIAGRDLDAGENVPNNHLVLSPRDDNRGVKITADAWVLIKGSYILR